MSRVLTRIHTKAFSFIMVVFTSICSVGYLVTKKIASSSSIFSYPSTLGFHGELGLSALGKKIYEVEGKVNMLLERSCTMLETEELFNAAVCHVDALEAELISVKKALHEALIRQEELFAYVDSQSAALSKVRKSCW